MATISRDKKVSFGLQKKFELTYTAIILVILLMLNTYPLTASQNLIFQAKQSSLENSVALLVSTLSALDSLSEEEVSAALNSAGDHGLTRILVVDASARVLYDSREGEDSVGKYAFYTEVIQALEGYKAFHCAYRSGSFQSRAASPILFRGQVVGAVYAYEYDAQQAVLLGNLQRTLGGISVLVGLLVLVISIFFSRAMTYRVSELLQALRQVGEGSYSHRVSESGSDEITELGREFNDMVRRIQVTEDMRRRFVSDASHELKTPLAGICLLSDSILQSPQMEMETVREFVGDIGQEAERLRRITEKLLRLTRLESRKFEDNIMVLEAAPVLEKVVHMLEPLAAEKQVELSWCAQDGCCIMDDEDSLHQVIFNLTENAVKYNNPGGWVFAELCVEQDEVVLRVEDNGIGIPEEDLPFIFQRFYRVDQARNQESGSSGLGLAIVHETVTGRGGTIEARRRAEGGTVFEVRWPAVESEVAL